MDKKMCDQLTTIFINMLNNILMFEPNDVKITKIKQIHMPKLNMYFPGRVGKSSGNGIPARYSGGPVTIIMWGARPGWKLALS